MQEITEATEYIRSKGITDPEIGIVLGTGLGNAFVEKIEDPVSIDYYDIPHFPTATIEYHKGKLIYGTLHGKKILVMQGRYHYYEGYSMQQITLPIRVMKVLGVRNLLISNAAGNLNTGWKKGDLMLLDDHINLLPDNPLRGPNVNTLGPRFPDMSQPYAEALNSKLIELAKENKVTLRVGVYAAVIGPNLETRAEYRYLQRIGADAVGMSTIPEVIVANHMSLPCCAISVLTDDCDPDNLSPANINDIIATAGKAEPALTTLYSQLIASL